MKCEICGTEHEKWQAHVFQKNAGPGDVVSSVPLVSSPQFDRRTYQREYMRSYRKKQSLMVQTAKALLEHVAEPWPRA